MIEFITKPSVANREDRVERGRLVKQICGNNAFPPLHELIKGARFPNNGNWFCGANEKMISATGFRNTISRMWKDQATKSKDYNRHARRTLARKATMREFVRSLGPTWGTRRSDWGDIPVSEELIKTKVLQKFISGRCSDSDFEAKLNSWVSDPMEFSRIVYDYADHPNVIEKYFGEQMIQISEVVSQMQSAVSEIKVVNKKILEQRERLVQLGMPRPEARRLTGQIKMPTIDKADFSQGLEARYGVGRAGHFAEYMEHVGNSEHKFKPSDVMDLMQMCYAYDCDLFRCDRAMADIFKDFHPFQGKLVRSLGDLLAITRAIPN